MLFRVLYANENLIVEQRRASDTNEFYDGVMEGLRAAVMAHEPLSAHGRHHLYQILRRFNRAGERTDQLSMSNPYIFVDKCSAALRVSL